MRKLNISKRICALVMVLVLVLSQVFASVVVFADETVPAIYVENNGSRLVAKVENFTVTSYQWQRAVKDGENYGEYVDITGATLKYYDITTEDEGSLIRVVANKTQNNSGIASEPTDKPIGKLVVFDLAKGGVTFNTSYSGKNSAGNTVSGTHVATNIYVVKQSNKETMTTNSIDFKGNHPSNPFDLTLAGVNMGEIPTKHNQQPGSSGINTPTLGQITIPAKNDEIKHVVIRLKDENIVRHIRYYNGGDTQTPASVKSSLKFTDINGDGATDGGSLYMPIKLAPDEIENFVKTQTNYNHWNAGIGGNDSYSLVQNLTIAGGKLQVVTTLGDNCTAIGAGGNGYCQMEITGGEVIAHCNGTGAAIGGGIGWNSAGGPADIVISGGNVYAKNHSRITSGAEIVGGVAIGGGSSFHKDGSRGNISIIGATVEAYGTFGNGIGGGNSSTSKGGGATININSGNVTASSIGGGNSKNGTAGDATVTVNSPANVMLTGDIGGGTSESGDGGDAAITVNGGTLNCGGVIGGGNGGLTGNGGKATVTVNNGKLTATSVGGGTGGTFGNGGAAEIYINGGTIETGSIGGGGTLNATGKLGYAKGVITGGDIRGQFLMVAGGTDKCTFEMSGGTLHGVNALDNTKYTKPNGAAVYMDDTQGEVIITGGTISDCNAQKGGAIYMTAGTFTIGNDLAETEKSTKATITGCEATEDGGAVYLGGGMMIVKNNAIITNNEAGRDGGAAYVGKEGIAEKGLVEVSGGLISNNTAAINGGGIAMADGDFMMYGGKVTHNSATTGNGGGIYVSSDTEDVNVSVRSGEVSNNYAKLSGGAVAVVGSEDINARTIKTTIGVKDLHFTQDGNPLDCEHALTKENSIKVKNCPVFTDNKGERNGGAIYIAGNDSAILNIYCLEESGSVSGGDKNQSDFMKVEGGQVLISTSNIEEEERLDEQNSQYGYINIQSTMYYTAGRVNIWGNTDNPHISNVITVDIEKEGDYFKDHREYEKFYKLLYFENFTDSTGFTSGQYKEIPVQHGTSAEILGNIYNHPGYTIVGWNTDPKGFDDFDQGENDSNSSKGWYKVGHTYTFDNNPIGDLTIYAIWEAIGYRVVYDPNVPSTEAYFGTMEAEDFTYDTSIKLSKNKFERPTYEFLGWSKNPNGPVEYIDEEEVVNLTTKKGEVVILYAQWEGCDHNPNTHQYSYKTLDDGKTLERTCSCGRFNEKITLLVSDSVYDMKEHPAKTMCSSHWNLPVSYTKDGQTFSGVPKSAGEYVASISEGGCSVNVNFVIEKAEQDSPLKPEYEPIFSETEANLKIKEPVNPYPIKTTDSTYDSKLQYRLVYYVGDVEFDSGWKDIVAAKDGYVNTFTMPKAMTNYYIYARYSEGTNYKASKEIRADSSYFYEGDIIVDISCGEGINYSTETTDGTDSAQNGITVLLELQDGYYFPKDFNVTVVTQDLDTSEQLKNQATIRVIEKNKKYIVENIPTKSHVIITIPNARKHAQLYSKVSPNQVFGKVTTDKSIISKDASFTAFFDIKNYNSNEYSPLSFNFSEELPLGTKLILLDKLKGTYYWYNVKDSNLNTCSLHLFKQMGTDTNLVISDGDMKLQLIMDFSEVEKDDLLDNTVTITVEAVPIQGSNAIVAETSVFSELKDIATSLLKSTVKDLTTTIMYEISKSLGETTKWKDYHSAIILTPKDILPSDAYITYTDGNYTVSTYRNGKGDFVIPLGEDNNLSSTINITLNSKLLEPGEKEYSFDCKWMVAKSKAESSYGNGEVLSNVIPIIIKTQNVSGPSLKFNNVNPYYSSGAVANPTIEWKDVPTSYKMTVMLMMKNDNGEYISTALQENIKLTETEGSYSFQVPLAGQNKGSYSLRVRLDAGLVNILEVDEYFIIK